MESVVVCARHKLALLCLIPILASICVSAPGHAAAGVKISDIFAPYLKMQSFQGVVQTTTTLTPTKGGPGTNIFSTINLSYKAPNRLFMQVTGLTGGAQIVSNGSVSYEYSAMTNSYSSGPAPQKPLTMLASLFAGSSNLKLSGRKAVNGHQCNVYTGIQQSEVGPGKVTIYQDSSSKLIQTVVISVPDFGTPRGGRYSLLITENYANQEVNPAIPASKFQFQPPPGSEKAPASTIPSLLGSLSPSMP